MTIQTEGREFNELYDIWHNSEDNLYIVKYQSDRKGEQIFNTYEEAKAFGESL